jgi:RecJ-like exonuclease
MNEEEDTMTLRLNGEIIALYLEGEIACPLCATEGEIVADSLDESLMFEELEGHVDELWCDRCGVMIFSSSSVCADCGTEIVGIRF